MKNTNYKSVPILYYTECFAKYISDIKIYSGTKQTAIWNCMHVFLTNPDYDLKQDIFTGEIIFQGNVWEAKDLFHAMLLELQQIGSMPLMTFLDLLDPLLKSRQYNPIRDYLEKCKASTSTVTQKETENKVITAFDAPNAFVYKSPFEVIPEVANLQIPAFNFSNLALEVFGLEDRLSQQMLSGWLVGAVKRALEPGCQWRQMLVLQGTQGIGKTQFVRTLFGDTHYLSIDSQSSDEHLVRLIQRCWVAEFEELEAINNKRSVEQLKRFISVQEDQFKLNHVETLVNLKRKCVFIGTVNSTEFLRDSTGNSRFWVLSIPGQINLDFVRKHRDAIWAAAYELYLNGEQGWSEELVNASEENNKKYMVTNSFVEPITELISDLEAKFIGDDVNTIAVKLSDVMTALDIRLTDHSKFRNKIADALKEIGFEKTVVRLGKTLVKCFSKPYINKPTVLTLQAGQWKKTI